MSRENNYSQGEPVAWTWQGALEQLKDYCPDGVTVFKHKGPGTTIPLYTHGDLVEVERLQAALAEMTTYRDNAANHMRRIRAEATAFEKERDTLRANLAKAHELLSEALRSVHADAEKSESSVAVDELEELASRIDAALSASAEPSALEVAKSDFSRDMDDLRSDLLACTLEENERLTGLLAERDALLEEAYCDGWNDGQEAIEQRYQNTPRSSTEGWEKFKADNLSASNEVAK